MKVNANTVAEITIQCYKLGACPLTLSGYHIKNKGG